jgi:methanethiol S-methyltransferase
MSTLSTLLLLMAWGAYFFLHSWLASVQCKRKVAKDWPRLWRRYRLIYNLVATILLLPLVLLLWWLPSPLIWQWSAAWGFLMDGLAIAAILAFIDSLRYYPLASFLGISPAGDEGPLIISPYHRFVRHPWYLFGLIALWTRPLTLNFLLFNLLVTLYIVIALRHEEQRLISEYGDSYRNYRIKVPALIPRPWRWLGKEEVALLLPPPPDRESSH